MVGGGTEGGGIEGGLIGGGEGFFSSSSSSLSYSYEIIITFLIMYKK